MTGPDSSQRAPLHVTCDLVLLAVRAGTLNALLVRRREEPYAGRLALPGGVVQADEDLTDTAYRALAEQAEVRRSDVILEQLAAYGAPDRDPRFRVVSVAWLALGADLPEPTAAPTTASIPAPTPAPTPVPTPAPAAGPAAAPDARQARWVPVVEALGSRAGLAFDHARILADGVERARATLEDTGCAAALCGVTFTVADLHAVYEAVWGVALDRANFHRKVTGVEGFLTPTGELREGGRGRPARVYRGDPRATLSPPILRGDR
ncbi:MAG TPA: NUDIX domain-containing protein [Dermatophilaceae bacterium]|nr:NUDIX domain-containing protein [Dermatophilaceae bacterium]